MYKHARAARKGTQGERGRRALCRGRGRRRVRGAAWVHFCEVATDHSEEQKDVYLEEFADTDDEVDDEEDEEKALQQEERRKVRITRPNPP